MFRVLARNGLALPGNHTAQARLAAGARKQAFIDPPARRNRLWQADFSEFETSGASAWNPGGAVELLGQDQPRLRGHRHQDRH